MKLSKPPIIQAWIELHFENAPDCPEWGWQTAAEFLDQFHEDYPEREMAVQHQLQIEKVKKESKTSNCGPRCTFGRDARFPA